MTESTDDIAFNVTYLECGVALIVLALAIAGQWWRSRGNSFKCALLPNPPKDTVVLHQYGKGLTVPSISPFVMKLETYLRVTKIPYENKYDRIPGPKSKLPWIQYNNLAVPDSQLCIQFLNAEKKISLNSYLTPEQRAIGQLVRRTAEESLYWVLLIFRLDFEKTGELYKKLGLPSLIVWYMRRAAKPKLWSQGIGRFTQEEVMKILEEDLEAISQILGKKKFLFGDKASGVTEFDCALFGPISELLWQMPGTTIGNMIAEKFPNLVRFCEEMKAAFWPDWKERLLLP